MQLLVVGMPLPNPRIDNYSFFSAPSFFDYDAILIDPLHVSTLLDEVTAGGVAHEISGPQPLVNAPTAGLNVGLGDFLRRRLTEMERFLDRGGTIGVFARPNQAHPYIAGFPGADRYCWLPAPAGMRWDEPILVPAFGTEVDLTDRSSQFASFIDAYRRWFHYRAYLSERFPAASAAIRVFARSAGGAAVAADIPCRHGHIVLLPAMFEIPAGETRFSLASNLLDCLRLTVHAAAEGQPPDWAVQEDFPGLAPLLEAEEDASKKLQEADEHYATAAAELKQVARFRDLLWQEGAFGLEPIVRDAFQLLGFYVTLDRDRPAVLEADGRDAMLEVEGAEGEVVEWPYFRLQKRLEADLLISKLPKKGVIVVNGYRQQPPVSRPTQYSETLRIASENYRYALVTTTQLVDLVRAAMQDASPEHLRRLRDLIFEMDGVTLPEGFPRPA